MKFQLTSVFRLVRGRAQINLLTNIRTNISITTARACQVGSKIYLLNNAVQYNNFGMITIDLGYCHIQTILVSHLYKQTRLTL